ncbi:MAG TPA: hypothetical protein VID47_07970 [Actinomycetota bacterium]|jgi:hypothetical protein
MNRRLMVAAALAAASLGVAACGAQKIGPVARPALLLDQLNSTPANVHVGQEFTNAVVLLRSESDSPVTIRKVTFTEPRGVGTVVKVEHVMATPVSKNDDWPVRVWSSYPPTAKIGGMCRSMPLQPVVGATIPPHGAARLVVLFRALKAGDYFIDGQAVSYEVGSGSGRTTGSITLPNRFIGTVTPTGGTVSPDPIEQACAQLGHLLKGEPAR